MDDPVGMARKAPAKPLSNVTKAFAARLTVVRESAGYLKKAHFARAIGVEPPAYRKWERGQAEPNVSHLARIQEITGVSLDYLIAGRIPAQPMPQGFREAQPNGQSRDAG